MRISSKNGFKVQVAVEDGLPHVQVSFPDGEVVLATNRISVTGLQKLPEVFAVAASMAFDELERYYDTQRRLAR